MTALHYVTGDFNDKNVQIAKLLINAGARFDLMETREQALCITQYLRGL